MMERIDGQRLERLRACAETARDSHYAPYSSFMVLAAVEASDGSLHAGSNVEIANFSLSKHAEEVAILTAISAGQNPTQPWLTALYVAGAAPCGSCRQFAHEFAIDDAICVIDKLDQTGIRQPLQHAAGTAPPDIWTLADLLPKAFGPADLLG